MTPADALRLQRTAGNAAVTRLIAEQRRPPEAQTRRLQRDGRKAPYGVVPAMHADDRNRRFEDPADRTVKPVWTAEGGYAKNPSARSLSAVLSNGKVGGGFKDGLFMYVVNEDGEVIVGARLGQRGNVQDRATGMPHPTLVGGKDPKVLAAGEVEIRAGRIYRVNNQSGHYQPTRGALRATAKAFMKLPTTAFHTEFKMESVHFDAAGAMTKKGFRSLDMLKLWKRSFKSALRGLKPRAIAGKLRGQRFRSGAKSFLAGLVLLAVMYFLSKLTGDILERVEQQFMDKRLDDLEKEIEEKLLENSNQLDDLLEEDSDGEIYINVRVRNSEEMAYGDLQEDGVPPMQEFRSIHLVDAGFSREPWDPTPYKTKESNCFGRSSSTIVAASYPFKMEDLFSDDDTTATPGSAGQPATR
jgi:hypothetical protein